MELVMEKAIRILVANRPRMMRELILATFAEQPDIEIVGEAGNDEEILSFLEKTTPDLVVVALDEPGKRPRICDAVLQGHPEIKIIGLADQQNYSALYWAYFAIHSVEVDASEEGILSAVRGQSNVEN